jgi:general secretion pathway protein F
LAPPSQAITVEQLLALNDEIRALARAGVPLERGLRALGSDMPGRLGRLATSLGQRLERGESLIDVLDSSGDSFPPAYRALVAAGLRSGRLPAALESISRSVRQAIELRRTVIVALTYPVILALIATAVLVFSVSKTVPVVSQLFDMVNAARPAWYEALMAVAQRTVDFLPWIWGGILTLGLYWWFRSRRAARLASGGRSWLPTIGAVRSAGRMATFAEILAVLVEHQVPLDEAVQLAGAAAGGRELQQAGSQLAAALRRGEYPSPAPRGLPPLLAWLIATSASQPHLSRALRHSAAAYRRRAMRISILLGTYVPIFLSAIVGGAIALYYVVLTMAPFYYLLYELGQP